MSECQLGTGRQHARACRLNAPTSQHVIVRVVCDGVDVRRRLGAAFALVGCNHGGCVDWQPFVWVHRHAEEPRVGLRKARSVETARSASTEQRGVDSHRSSRPSSVSAGCIRRTPR